MGGGGGGGGGGVGGKEQPKKSMNGKHVHIPSCQKKWGLSYTNQENRVSHILFVEKNEANHIPGSAEKGGHSARTSVLCHI